MTTRMQAKGPACGNDSDGGQSDNSDDAPPTRPRTSGRSKPSSRLRWVPGRRPSPQGRPRRWLGAAILSTWVLLSSDHPTPTDHPPPSARPPPARFEGTKPPKCKGVASLQHSRADACFCPDGPKNRTIVLEVANSQSFGSRAGEFGPDAAHAIVQAAIDEGIGGIALPTGALPLYVAAWSLARYFKQRQVTSTEHRGGRPGQDGRQEGHNHQGRPGTRRPAVTTQSFLSGRVSASVSRLPSLGISP